MIENSIITSKKTTNIIIILVILMIRNQIMIKDQFTFWSSCKWTIVKTWISFSWTIISNQQRSSIVSSDRFHDLISKLRVNLFSCENQCKQFVNCWWKFFQIVSCRWNYYWLIINCNHTNVIKWVHTINMFAIVLLMYFFFINC